MHQRRCFYTLQSCCCGVHCAPAMTKSLHNHQYWSLTLTLSTWRPAMAAAALRAAAPRPVGVTAAVRSRTSKSASGRRPWLPGCSASSAAVARAPAAAAAAERAAAAAGLRWCRSAPPAALRVVVRLTQPAQPTDCARAGLDGPSGMPAAAAQSGPAIRRRHWRV